MYSETSSSSQASSIYYYCLLSFGKLNICIIIVIVITVIVTVIVVKYINLSLFYVGLPHKQTLYINIGVRIDTPWKYPPPENTP